MYIDHMEAAYFTGRLQTTLDMASRAVDPGAKRAHDGLASCYREKLASLLRVVTPPARNILSLNVFGDRRSATATATEPLDRAIGIYASRT